MAIPNPLSARNKVARVKIESAYGVDSSPANTDAVLLTDLTVTPLDGTTEQLQYLRGYMGGYPDIRTANFGRMSFSVPLNSSGTAGTPPAFGPMLRACGMAQTLTAAPITGTSTAVGSNTITLAGTASATNDIYNGMVITASSQSRIIIGYNGTTKVATVSSPWSPALTGTPTYTIGANAQYTPISSITAMESATFYYYQDTVLHTFLGCRGNASIMLEAAKLPMIRFEFLGVLGTRSDVSAPASDVTDYFDPLTVSVANTVNLNVQGYTDVVLKSIGFDLGNSTAFHNTVGRSLVMITDRMTKGSVSMELTPLASFDPYTLAINATRGKVCVQHGVTAGSIFTAFAPSAQRPNADESEMDSILMVDSTLNYIPVLGNDEIRFTFG